MLARRKGREVAKFGCTFDELICGKQSCLHSCGEEMRMDFDEVNDSQQKEVLQRHFVIGNRVTGLSVC